jgi:hypothetical protein
MIELMDNRQGISAMKGGKMSNHITVQGNNAMINALASRTVLSRTLTRSFPETISLLLAKVFSSC